MPAFIEVLPVGPDGRLFQICDGERYGYVETDGIAERWQRGRDVICRHPSVIAYIGHWLSTDGVLVGSQHAPRLSWDDICLHVPEARGVLH
ncbi:hypothetical protein GXW78_07725 [Roseomonas terrae]|jgi:hypothetical protein|uniref:Uncharacterized protein n=1 Tax=Neoroseomonas terrae TaxID=424799 RepID=A0ABS5EEV0_9PROT|nr:hypothetical protein [Neoroseomonas terrae]MBR0649544.1 hypothetical protein [Neoroseomonas terrae]